MYRGAGLHGSVVSRAATGAYDETLPGVDCQRLPGERYCALPIIEISDKDYRSFCWPCHALEETGDGRSGS